jgi:signal transduction histidine kinase
LLTVNAPRSPEAEAATEKGAFEEVLRQTIARLEETNHRKDDFFAVLAHEMRTPLHATLTWIEVLRGTDDPKTKEQALASIERSMKLQARMIDDLLDVSKISTGKLFLELQELDLASVVGNAFEMVLPEATGKGIEMELVVEPGSIPMCGDLARLEQVVSNILSNAIKFTRKGGKVSVDVAVVGEQAEIRVMDTGEGISPDVLPHIFERYRQGDSSVSQRESGLGLGLTIARHIAELHGGRIHAESPGKGLGATLRVHLPLKRVSGNSWSAVSDRGE